MFQVRGSVKALCLYDVTWLTADIHRLMSCLSITYLDYLVLSKTCHLRFSLPAASPSSPVKVNILQIGTSLAITTLVSILSYLDVNKLSFHAGCQMIDMDMNTAPTPQVSRGNCIKYAECLVPGTTDFFLAFQTMIEYLVINVVLLRCRINSKLSFLIILPHPRYKITAHYICRTLRC